MSLRIPRDPVLTEGVPSKRMKTEFEPTSPVSRSIFCILTYTVVSLLVYAYASYHVSSETLPLIDRCQRLQEALTVTSLAVTELSTVVTSLSDPAADEYALITELGRVPDGTCKVLYQKSRTPNVGL